MAAPPTGADLRVLAPGYRSENRSLVATDQAFRLRPGLPVRVEITNLPAGLGEDAAVLAEFTREVGTSRLLLTPGDSVTLPAPGGYRIQWRVRVSFGSSSRGRRLSGIKGPPQTAQVRDTADLQVLEIPFPPELEAEARQVIRDLRDGR